MAEAAGVGGGGEGIGVGIGDLAHRGVLDLALPALAGPEFSLWTQPARNRRYARRQDWMPEDWEAPGQVHTAHLLDFDNDGDRDLLLVSAPLLTPNREGSAPQLPPPGQSPGPFPGREPAGRTR